MATWKDKCCFSFIDKQNLGLIPSGGSSTDKCLSYSITYNSFGVGSPVPFLMDIDGLYFPSAGLPYEIGTAIQTSYQADSGGFAYQSLNNDIRLWSLENNPVTTNFQIQNNDDFNFYPVTFGLLTCDLKQRCWEVDIPDSGPILNFFSAGVYPFDNVDFASNYGLTTTDLAFPIYLQSVFGGQATITVNDNGSSCYIKIENCYDAIRPKSINVNFNNYGFTEIDCL